MLSTSLMKMSLQRFGNEMGGTPGIQRDMCAAFRIVGWKI